MSFRKFGGLKYSAKHNSVSSYYNTSNNLQVTTIGQPNTYIVVESGLTGNISTNTVPDNAWIEAAIQAAVQAAVKGLTPTEMIGHAGPTGPQGLAGPQGPQGLQGLQGLHGLQGLQGLHGETGSQGLQGIQGLQGLQGIQGLQGLHGETGPQGIQGLNGETGAQGLHGETGAQGIQGPTGPQGPPGTPSGTTGDASTIFTLKDARKSIDILGPLILQASRDNTTIVPTSYSKDVPIPSDIVSVFVGTDVTSIGDYAFYQASGLKTVTFAQGSQLASIGYYAFFSATSLPSITIPNTVTNIGDYAFYQASGLKTVTFAQGSQLKSIGDFAFSGPNMLTSIEIPNTVITIGDFAFNTADKLTEINVPASVIAIGTRAFSYAASLTFITVDSNNNKYSSDKGVLFDKEKTELIQYPIGNTQTSYIIPNSVTTIGGGAFEIAKILTNINVPPLVTSIDPNAFISSGVKTVVFEKSSNLKGLKIGSGQTFFGATGVTISVIGQTNFTIVDGTTQGIDIQGNLAQTSYINITTLNNIKITLINIKSVSVGTNVTSIEADAFKSATMLQSISIPNTVTSIGASAFYGASSLTTVTVDPSNNNYLSDDYGVLFNKNKTTLIQYPIGNTQTSYTIPNTVTNISDYAFYGANKLITLTFASDSTLNSIGKGAFQNATTLSSIDIPASVTNISDDAFNGATGLKTLTFAAGSQLQIIGANAFKDANNLTTIDIPNKVTSIGYGTFWNAAGLKTVTFASGSQLQIIGANAFLDAKSLMSIDFPDSVTSIGNYAFQNAKSLMSIDFPASVTSIGANAFQSTYNLKTVTFAAGSKLQIIGEFAFSFAIGLLSIEIPASVKSIGRDVFDNARGLVSITFGTGSQLRSIGQYAFYQASSLTSITIPAFVTSIGTDAFETSGLKTVIFESSSSLSNFKVSIGPNKPFYGASVTISVLGQTEFTLTNGTLIGRDISGILTVPNGVDLNSIIKVSVGTYVTSIGGTAFQNANNLTSITIPNTVTTISDYAFFKATVLTTVTFAQGSKLDSIGENAFSGTNLGTMEIPASVTSIEDSAFNGANKLSTLTFASGSQLRSIGTNAFYQATSLTSITIPAFVTSIGNYAFYKAASLSSITFADGSKLTSIGSNAFDSAINLTSIIIPASVTSIGTNAFLSSGLKTVLFNSINNLRSLNLSIGITQTFYGATSVTISVLGQTNFGLTNGTGKSAYVSEILSTSALIEAGVTRVNDIKTVFVGSTVTKIDDRLFYNATNLTLILIPSSVTSIGGSVFENSGLKTVVFVSITNLISLGFTIGAGQTFYGAKDVTISANDYKPTVAAVTNYYYPGETSSPISIDTKGYTRCDVLIVGSGGSAGNTLVGAGTILFGGGGGGGGSASFTNIPCNPINGKIEFTITQSGSSWVLNNWVKDGTAIKCNLTAENGGNGSSYILNGSTATGGAGGAGGSTAKSDIGILNTLSLPVKLTGNSGKPGSGEKRIIGDNPSSLPSYVSGGDPGAILTNFKAPLDKKYGKGSSNQKITIPRLATSSIVYPEDPPGAAFIQVNRYNVP